MHMKKTCFLYCFFSIFVFLTLAFGCYSSTSNRADADRDAEQDARADDAPDAVPDLPPDAVPDAVPPGPYVLHEWGVISIGEFGALVHGPSPASSDMVAEKPVIYLYPEGEMGLLDVGVRFASGAASDVWPPIPAGPRIEWSDMDINPGPGPCEPTPFPLPWDDPLCEICSLGSCVVEEAGCIIHPHEEGEPMVSKLLFYAGSVGDYRPALTAGASFDCDADIEWPCVSFYIENDSPYDIERAWLVYRETAGACLDPWDYCPITSADIAFEFIEEIPSGETVLRQKTIRRYEAALDPEGNPLGELPLPDEWIDLGKDLLVELLDKGLTEPEAAAFVNNWQHVYFGLMDPHAWNMAEPLYSNGAFLIYFMDTDEYDRQFELSADPPPREAVRVGMIYQKLDLPY